MWVIVRLYEGGGKETSTSTRRVNYNEVLYGSYKC